MIENNFDNNVPQEERKIKIVNKLILVGNGFDLSLGLKTSYEDFLHWYFRKIILQGLKKVDVVKDNRGNLIYNHFEDEMVSFSCSSYVEFISHFEKDFDEHFFDFKTIRDKFLKKQVPQDPFELKFKSKLLKKICEESVSGWVDIESAYFNLLKKNLDVTSKGIDILNKELEYIKIELNEYLNQLDYSFSKDYQIARPYITQFVSDVSKEELISSFDKNETVSTEKIFFLNFNYTPSVYNVVNHIRKNNEDNKQPDVIINDIHGCLHDVNSMVFGYGDEIDDGYKTIEGLNDNRFFEGIKSFKYSENSNYRELLRFLNSNDYQVCVYGHSCGLSDRLMLNEVFEHDKCKSIKIYYYNKNEFVNKTMDISRHFKNNQIMRQRIVEFNQADKIPQLKKN
ncbi:AbiH family protein [Aestuariivivens marinum]|uniref:AbiH family protein n=1 Tax=Aestuariivivens marinum TaxID=2913555 RepID=UPI001F57ACC8|nr:AbiH family protein [Aestuariivivens marinum]